MEKLSIVIPAYNEEKIIARTLETYGLYFQKLKKQGILDFEIIVVLNGCRDRTLEAAMSVKKRLKEIKVVEIQEAGKGLAIIKGFNEALETGSELIGFVDADMATLPEDFYYLFKRINNYDGVIASRWIRGSIVKKRTLKRRVLSRGFNFIVRGLFLFGHRDTQCGAKLFKKEVIEKIVDKLRLTQWAFDINILHLCKKYGFSVIEVPTKWIDKQGSKINTTRTPIQMLLGSIRLRLIDSWFEPLLGPLKVILGPADRLINKK